MKQTSMTAFSTQGAFGRRSYAGALKLMEKFQSTSFESCLEYNAFGAFKSTPYFAFISANNMGCQLIARANPVGPQFCALFFALDHCDHAFSKQSRAMRSVLLEEYP
jgi:hypothetical protein